MSASLTTDDCAKELKEVKQELLKVESQIDDLLQRQQSLKQRQTDLELKLKHNANKQSQDKKWETKDFPWSKDLEDKMRSVFKLDKLRPMQLQTMNVTMSGKDCILIMPTGGGKSLCFQLPSLLSKGVTLVVSPLVSLMEDQVMALEGFGIQAAKLNAACDKQTVNAVQQSMIDKKSNLRLLYVTPEKLAKSKRFMNKLEKMYEMGRFSRLVIDEVHCCSQWGHDFRPDYKFLGIMKRQFPSTPILGLTATATTKVLDDVKKILNIQHCLIFKASFNRPNLYYEVKPKPSSSKETIDYIQKLIKSKFDQKSGIIYCFSQKDCEETTVELQRRGIKAGCYHAAMNAQERSHVHRQWLSNHIHVVVATVAFGMGIDKPDVRFVIHHSLSKSMENLYQESGRAGRDDIQSHCIILYRFADVFRQSTMVFTEQTGIDNLYGIMEYCIDASKCRRSIFAKHFGEVWNQLQCNSMCDHCDSNSKGGSEETDVTRLCQNVVAILNKAASSDQRLTANKILDAWEGKGPTSTRVKGQSVPTIPREKLEVILAQMLLKGYLREDFHFTAYSTISYIVKEPKAGLIETGMAKVIVQLPRKQKIHQNHNAMRHEGNSKTDKAVSISKTDKAVSISKTDKAVSISKTDKAVSNSKASKTDKAVSNSKAVKVTICKPCRRDSENNVTTVRSTMAIYNTNKSFTGDNEMGEKKCKQTSSSSHYNEVSDNTDSDDDFSQTHLQNSRVDTPVTNGNKVTGNRKRKKPVIVDSDSDLEFGEDIQLTNRTVYKKKINLDINSCSNRSPKNSQEPIFLDSSSDEEDKA